MISRNLLLILLISCVCAGALEVNVSKSLYQAEENNSVTLEWKFTPEPDGSNNSLSFVCKQTTDQQDSKILYHLEEGKEGSGSQFSGRVQCDRVFLSEGRLRLHVSRLRTEDSGQYKCDVWTKQDWGADKCRLNVTATVAQEPHTTTTAQPDTTSTAQPDTTSTAQPDTTPTVSLKKWHIILIVLAVLVAAAAVIYRKCSRNQQLHHFLSGLLRSNSSLFRSLAVEGHELHHIRPPDQV